MSGIIETETDKSTIKSQKTIAKGSPAILRPKVSKSRLKSFQPGKIWLDNNRIHVNAHGGGFIYDKNRYYWFGEHKMAGEAGNLAHVGVHCYSSTDLYNWKDEGISLSVIDSGAEHPLTKGCILERPKVIFNKKTQTYVMWFHLERKGQGYSTRLAGIATSLNITGPYKFIKAYRPNKKVWPLNVLKEHKENVDERISQLSFKGNELPETDFELNILGRDFESGQMSADITLFVDEDDKAYLIYASEENSTLHISLLSDDYLSCSGTYVRAFPLRFMEAPTIFKRHGKYYLIMSGCSGWEPTAARLAIADSIWGPWHELGNPCVGKNADKTFSSQGTYILPVTGKKDAYIFMADSWNPQNAIDGRYVWLPIQFDSDDKIFLKWNDEWDLSFFDN